MKFVLVLLVEIVVIEEEDFYFIVNVGNRKRILKIVDVGNFKKLKLLGIVYIGLI